MRLSLTVWAVFFVEDSVVMHVTMTPASFRLCLML